jgi:hypothetical protein
MLDPVLTARVLVILSAANTAALISIARKVSKLMSTPEFDKLTKDVLELKAEKLALAATNTQLEADKAALTTQVQSLTEQLAAAQSAAPPSPAEVSALDAQVEPALDTSAPVAPPATTPEAPPAA